MSDEQQIGIPADRDSASATASEAPQQGADLEKKREARRAKRLAQLGTRYISGQQVCIRYGDITPMTLWRWRRDRKLGFPPAIQIGGQIFFREQELDEFDERCLELTLPETPEEGAGHGSE